MPVIPFKRQYILRSNVYFRLIPPFSTSASAPSAVQTPFLILPVNSHQAVALLDGFAVLHPLDKDHGGSFFATDTKHWVPSLGDSGVFRPAGGGCPPRVLYSAAKAAPLRAQRGCISFPAAGSFGDTKRGNDMGIVSA